ncbi:hypothetical protein [Hoeflea olei]|uniref:YdhG-like domain-containing protein n=1 Tax=Hoeflea olei TaxID=1480615 RepID=A0A1C1YUI4_9HYPH|nr:hypothetical protein [Hoeflea olei]OCW57097.1 hypothetical protein AWJ14_08085 [Hoeflea olei]
MTPAEAKALIEGVAARTPGVGALEESVKWGEQSFAPVRRNVGSSVRIAPRGNGELALMFICHTHLVDEFRSLYPDALEFEGNRAIVVRSSGPTDLAALEHCIALALTFKLRKRGRA